MSVRVCAGLVAVSLVVLIWNSKSTGALIAQFDPNDMSTLFQDGNVAGGTVAVTALGQPVRWMTDVRSPTPGGGALDTFIDVQQAGTGATLVDSPGGSILSFAGNGNLLGFDDDIGGTIDGTGGAMDTNTATLILVGQVNSAGSGIGTFLDMRAGAGNDGGFGLQYDYDSGQLQGLVGGASVAGTVVALDRRFVATLSWDGPNSSASLEVTSFAGTTTTVSAASNSAIDHDRFRLGTTASSTLHLNGFIGDMLIYNDVEDHSDVHARLVADHAVPEPGSLSLALGVLIALVAGPRLYSRHS